MRACGVIVTKGNYYEFAKLQISYFKSNRDTIQTYLSK